MSEQPKLRRNKEPVTALAERAPWMPPAELPPEIVGALQALQRGDAQQHQQQNALRWIMQLGANGGALYFPGDAGRRDTDFALGRLYVAQIIEKCLKTKLHPTGEHG